MLVIDKIKERIEFAKWLKNYPKECLENYLWAKKKLTIACSKRQVLVLAYNSRINCHCRNYKQYSKYDLEEEDHRYDLDIIGYDLDFIDDRIRFYKQMYILYLKYI